jgi:hypothetical protein
MHQSAQDRVDVVDSVGLMSETAESGRLQKRKKGLKYHCRGKNILPE